VTKLEKMARELNDNFSEKMNAAFLEKFGVALNTSFSLMSMSLVSSREDGQDMTPEQRSFAEGYSEGYATAMGMVRNRDYSRHYETA
jgi:hypothetical protein